MPYAIFLTFAVAVVVVGTIKSPVVLKLNVLRFAIVCPLVSIKTAPSEPRYNCSSPSPKSATLYLLVAYSPLPTKVRPPAPSRTTVPSAVPAVFFEPPTTIKALLREGVFAFKIAVVPFPRVIVPFVVNSFVFGL